MSENTNVVSSPPDIKVSPSVVQLSAFTHLVVQGLETEVRQQSLFFPKSVGVEERKRNLSRQLR